ncbi:hypothetical protein [Bradyrhizobium lablabi]|uniref:hypothetical protein n=1 Tax=Bradyrhizobium lablabi TaxID=722472 RepID=UPI00090CCD38|nr:hypothetical protein [Bradyrhizobium lablabi]SHM40895.1 hypothetical protein SAMN05444321_6246 [Bradyrhizobium lablabi]
MSETGCETFDRWCALNEQQAFPVAPTVVARFVYEVSALGIEKIWPFIGEISRAHYLIGLADPTLGGAVSAAINSIAKIEPPRCWPAGMKIRFQTLPYDMQVYVAAHEIDRDKVIRRAQQEAADARKPKEKTDGTSKANAA